VPGTPEDAKGLLLRAISDPNPVLFLEHKYLYRALKGMVPEDPYEIEFGQARIAREGRDLTIVTYGIGVLWALEEAAQSTASIEVIDLRTLIPWDKDAVLASVRKTNRVLVLHEAPMTAGFGAEIAARIAEEAFAALDAPPVRVAGEGFPIPFSTQMEKGLYSAHARLHDAVERLLAY
jgi:2-oxoisovalerate dehydrogenase E1 component